MTTTMRRPDPRRARSRSVATGKDAAAPAGRSSTLSLLRAGVRAMVHEQPDDALPYLEEAASAERLASGDHLAVDALAYLSSVRWALADIEGARADADRALALGPDRFAPNQKAGEIALRLGDSEQAVARFLAALRASEPGTANAKAAEMSLREARRRISRGIRHEARAPRLGAWASRLIRRRRERPAPGSVTAGVQPQG